MALFLRQYTQRDLGDFEALAAESPVRRANANAG